MVPESPRGQLFIPCPICGWASPFTAPTPIEAGGYLDRTVRRTLTCERAGCGKAWAADLVHEEVEATIRRTRCASLGEPERGQGWPAIHDTDPHRAISYSRAAAREVTHAR